MKSALAKARDKWLVSDDGKECCGGQPSGIYLKNRLERAFLAGANFSSGRIEELESVLREIAKSPQYRHAPNWVVIKCVQALKDQK